MIPAVKAKLLEGKRGLIVGIANDQSIAWGCAKAFRAFGAELAVTYLNDKAKKYVDPLARELEASILMPLDVRTPGEWQQRHIEGSKNIPLSRLAERLNDIPRNRPVIAMCAGGYRSSIAASVLRRAGYTRVSELTGGMAAVPV